MALDRAWETHEMHWSVLKMVLMQRSSLAEGDLRVEEKSRVKGLVETLEKSSESLRSLPQ